jgi:hypothetical protein
MSSVPLQRAKSKPTVEDGVKIGPQRAGLGPATRWRRSEVALDTVPFGTRHVSRRAIRKRRLTSQIARRDSAHAKQRATLCRDATCPHADGVGRARLLRSVPQPHLRL